VEVRIPTTGQVIELLKTITPDGNFVKKALLLLLTITENTQTSNLSREAEEFPPCDGIFKRC
jgi:hypothetical protein